TVTLPPARLGAAANRAIYLVQGDAALVGGDRIGNRTGAKLDASQPLTITAEGGSTVEILLLQGKPIGEPVVQHGPMVMNTREEIYQAFEDYQRTQYGGWPWKEHDHVHPRDTPRQAFYNGKTEYPPMRK
ncbi:pirin protein-like, putative, partial [Bodo saltans]